MKIITHEINTGGIDEKYKENLFNILELAGQSKTIEFESASGELANLLNNWNGSDSLEFALAELFKDTSKIRLLISEGGTEKFKSYCLSKAPHAEWGCCLSGFIGVEYAPEPNRLVTQLHETLHLLGVDECYHENTLEPKAECLENKCLMRHGVVSTMACPYALSQIQS